MPRREGKPALVGGDGRSGLDREGSGVPDAYAISRLPGGEHDGESGHVAGRVVGVPAVEADVVAAAVVVVELRFLRPLVHEDGIGLQAVVARSQVDEPGIRPGKILLADQASRDRLARVLKVIVRADVGGGHGRVSDEAVRPLRGIYRMRVPAGVASEYVAVDERPVDCATRQINQVPVRSVPNCRRRC